MKQLWLRMGSIFLLLITWQLDGRAGSSADTVKIDVSAVEKRFLVKNLSLLAASYNITLAKDNVSDAKLWFNPNLYYQTTLYNSQTHQYFADFYPNSGYSDETVQLQELVTLAGRHQATWQLAEVGIKQAEFQLADLLRNLRYNLYCDISDLYNNQHLLELYAYEEGGLHSLIVATQTLVKEGNAAPNELLQLQAQLQDIEAQRVVSQAAVLADQQALNTLLVNGCPTYFVVDSLPNIEFGQRGTPSYEAILDSAERGRPDLKLAYAGSDYANKNLKLQYASALPDLTVGTTVVGTNSSGGVGYTGLYASMDLPVFNRNQYNILGAKDAQKQAVVNDTLVLNTVRHQATAAYLTFLEVQKQLGQIESRYGNTYGQDLDAMFKNALSNYESRRINLLSLLSYLSTYTDGKTNLLSLKVQYFNAVKGLELNCACRLAQ